MEKIPDRSGYQPYSDAELLRRAANCTIEEVAKLIGAVAFLEWQWAIGTEGRCPLKEVGERFIALEQKVAELSKGKETE